MIISVKHKYIFISSPKTGSQSIRDYLLEVDDSARWNSFTLEQTKYFAEEHVTPYKLSQLIGKHYNDYNVFTFVRDPYAKTVSAYFFYRNGKASHLKGQRKLSARLNIILSRILPFQVWALIKPLRTNKEYLINRKGETIVDYIGRTENLEQDFSIICKKLDLPFDGESLVARNKSSYEKKQDYFKNPVFKWLFDFKQKSDLIFYKEVMDTFAPNQFLRENKMP